MNSKNSQIALPTSTGLKIIIPSDVIYCKADGSYSELHFREKEVIVVSKNLKVLQDRFPKDIFIRIHHKYLVNRYHITEIFINGGCHVILKCGKKLEVSLKKRASVIAAFEKL